jgi:hypothetical protein
MNLVVMYTDCGNGNSCHLAIFVATVHLSLSSYFHEAQTISVQNSLTSS